MGVDEQLKVMIVITSDPLKAILIDISNPAVMVVKDHKVVNVGDTNGYKTSVYRGPRPTPPPRLGVIDVLTQVYVPTCVVVEGVVVCCSCIRFSCLFFKRFVFSGFAVFVAKKMPELSPELVKIKNGIGSRPRIPWGTLGAKILSKLENRHKIGRSWPPFQTFFETCSREDLE